MVEVGKAWQSHAGKSPAVSGATQSPLGRVICNLNQSNFSKMVISHLVKTGLWLSWPEVQIIPTAPCCQGGGLTGGKEG